MTKARKQETRDISDPVATKLHTMSDAELRSACLLAVALCAKSDLWDGELPPYWLLLLNEAFARGWLTDDEDEFIAACLMDAGSCCSATQKMN